ncbi:hypothetical protein FPQ18DRAFT_301358 [Pyronema domesticum]|nr:hypothetical protein FPQ18DRAFT_301358 [Pyronema domesticum]
MALAFAPSVATGSQTVVPAGVSAPGAPGSATVKRKRTYVQRKKSAAATPTTGQAAPTAPKQRKRKAKVDPPSLPEPVSATVITEPTRQYSALMCGLGRWGG